MQREGDLGEERGEFGGGQRLIDGWWKVLPEIVCGVRQLSVVARSGGGEALPSSLSSILTALLFYFLPHSHHG
ncbi:hypothetical protein Nepgr_013869 [Nepenthes gracilis]|uniref:Uncharacterized protein n=1 Tax=Nepenthes gracilis TaxID=150966 RepID=A0AAD3XPC5_NEPGR|nr:hypothetical protein Nepgr_013869 [Nepenthes gracilis]